LLRLVHPNIVQVFGTIINNKQESRGLILELVDQPLLSRSELPWMLGHIAGLAAGLTYVHEQNIVYNALNDNTARVIGATAEYSGVAKLVDFTRSIVLDGSFHSSADITMKQQSPYAAPERFVSFKTDVYALGILGRKMFCPGDAIFALPSFSFGTALPPCEVSVSLGEQTSRTLAVLLDWCTEQQPCNRPTMEEARDILSAIDDHTAEGLLSRRASQVAAYQSMNSAIPLPWQRDGYRHSDWLYAGSVFEACSRLVEQRTSGALLQVFAVALVKLTNPVTTTAIVGDSDDDVSTHLPEQLAAFVTDGLTPNNSSRRRLYTFFATDDDRLDRTLATVLEAPLQSAQNFGRGVAVAMEPLHARELFAEFSGTTIAIEGWDADPEFLAVVHECRISSAYRVTLQNDYKKPCEALRVVDSTTLDHCALRAPPESRVPAVKEGCDAHFIAVRRAESADSSSSERLREDPFQAATGDLAQPTAHQLVLKAGTLLSPMAVVKIRIRQTLPVVQQGTQEVTVFHTHQTTYTDSAPPPFTDEQRELSVVTGGITELPARLFGFSGVLVRSSDGHTVKKIFYQQVLQSAYNRECRVGVQQPRPMRLLHRNVVEVLHRLVAAEAGSTELRVIGVTMAYAGRPITDMMHLLTPADHKSIASQIQQALQIAESYNITHGDLQPKNVFLQRTSDGSFVAKITNFPYARMYPVMAGNCEQRALFASPELRDSMNAATSADVFSFGMLLWWLVSNGVADHGLGLSAPQIRAAMVARRRPPLEIINDLQFRDVIASCWCQDATSRWTWEAIGDALRHSGNTHSEDTEQAAAEFPDNTDELSPLVDETTLEVATVPQLASTATVANRRSIASCIGRTADRSHFGSHSPTAARASQGDASPPVTTQVTNREASVERATNQHLTPEFTPVLQMVAAVAASLDQDCASTVLVDTSAAAPVPQTCRDSPPPTDTPGNTSPKFVDESDATTSESLTKASGMVVKLPEFVENGSAEAPIALAQGRSVAPSPLPAVPPAPLHLPAPSMLGSNLAGALCPLTFDLYRCALIAEDGYTYDRESLMAWFQVFGSDDAVVSPITGSAMGTTLKPDDAKQHLADMFRARAPTDGSPPDIIDAASARVDMEHLLRLPSVQSTLFQDLDQIRSLDLVEKLELCPPSLLAVGNENSGKSTLFNRLIGFPVLPRGNGFCTRMIVRVLLRRGPYIPAKVSVRTRGDAPRTVACEYASAAKLCGVVKNMMDTQMALSPKALVMNRELTVHIQLPHLCNLNIVDLPGLVATSNHHADLPQLTQELAKSAILEEGDLATYLLVCEATSSANLSLAAALIIEKKLEHRTLGVMTKMDLIAPINDDVTMTQCVAETILNRADNVRLQPAGWVGCSSREPSQATLQQVDAAREVWRLHAMEIAEQRLLAKWNDDPAHPLKLEAAALFGMRLLRRRVEEYFEHHLAERWIPKLLNRLTEEAGRLTTTNQQLGLPMPPDPTHTERALQVRALVSTATRYGATLPLVSGWIPASAKLIHYVLQTRLLATIALESRDWMRLSARTRVWSLIEKLSTLPAEKNSAWGSQGSIPYAKAHREAAEEDDVMRACATELVEQFAAITADISSMLCDAVFTEPAKPSNIFPVDNAFFEAGTVNGLTRECDERQASLTRMSRFAPVRRREVQTQLGANFTMAAEEFTSKAMKMIGDQPAAVGLTYERGIGDAVTCCTMAYRDSVGQLGHDIQRLWMTVVVLPAKKHVQHLAMNDSPVAESCHDVRVRLFSDAVTVARVFCNLLALQRRYRES
jgi:serine/threonine protein kinase